MAPQADPDTISAALGLRSIESPDATALDFPAHDRRLSFREWDQDSTSLARALVDAGIVPGDRVALFAENRVEWQIIRVALARAGAIVVPVNTHFRSEELRYVLAQSRARMVFLTESFRSNAFLEYLRRVESDLPDLEQIVTIGSQPALPGLATLEEMLAAGRSSNAALPEVRGGDACGIIYTSGTTGRPKGAVLTHEGVLANGREVFRRLEVTAGDVVTAIIPMFHSASLCTTMPGCVATGAAYAGLDAFDPVEMMRLIEDRRSTVHVGVPTTFRAMLNHPRRSEFDLSSLRVATCGGADADPHMLEECARAYPVPGLVQGYGLTEVHALATSAGPSDETRFATAGKPLPGYEIRIAPIGGDPSTTAPTGDEVGEVQIRTRYRMIGYFDMEAETEATFTADGWLRSGDVGRLTADGDLVLTGARIKDMIIRGGENIYPAEIEAVLHRHAGVHEVSVFGFPDDDLGEVVVAAVVCDPGVTPEELTAFCAERLSRFKVPTAFFAVSEMPLTASGKIRKVELRSQAIEGSLKHLAGALA
jgi:fatty-acyl-CoA synthase